MRHLNTFMITGAAKTNITQCSVIFSSQKLYQDVQQCQEQRDSYEAFQHFYDKLTVFHFISQFN